MEVGQKYQTMASNSNQVYRVKSINTHKWGTTVLFEISKDGINFNGLHNLGIDKVKDYIERERMVLIQ